MTESAKHFLDRHGMSPERIDPIRYAPLMAQRMTEGLEADGRMLPMIPTYLKNSGRVPLGENVVVIDAGGTNFRCALARFTQSGFELEGMKKSAMPGAVVPVNWEEFIRFVADAVEPFMDRTDKIGFCFSYSADITPEIDGRVREIDKEVVVNGAEGQLVGASLSAELARRGYPGKRAVILNDTAAVLLGVSATLDKERYSDFLGQINGTGTNTSCVVPRCRIPKLHDPSPEGVIVNLESGCYNDLPRGDFDLELDCESHLPGSKHLEKMTAGVYLGTLCRIIFRAAADEEEIEPETWEKIRALGAFNAAVIDAWAAGEGLAELGIPEGDAAFIRAVCYAALERSARAMCVNLTAIALLTGAGEDKPLCVCAEGSLVQKSRFFRPLLEQNLERYALGHFGRRLEMIVGYETTLPGAAAAALLNQ